MVANFLTKILFSTIFNLSFPQQLQLKPTAKCSKFNPTFTGTVNRKMHLAESLGFQFFKFPSSGFENSESTRCLNMILQK